MKPPLPPNEEARLARLQSFEILDTLPEQAYDDISGLASLITGTPIALVSLVDRERQWFKSKIGLDAEETPRAVSFCAHAILEPDDLMEVRDASLDHRFRDNPLVLSDPNIRFYAGAPLVTPEGEALGTLCVIDRVVKRLTDEQKEALRALSRQVMSQLQLRRAVAELEHRERILQRQERQLKIYQRKLESRNAELQVESATDPLTELMNRRAFEESLDRELERAVRYQTPLSLLMLDVDHFKSFNDSFGHPAGDEVLQRVAGLLRKESRKSDAVARYGGEEMAIVLPNTGTEDALSMAERFRCVIAEEPWDKRAITVSVGVASISDVVYDRTTLVEAADAALYAAKEAGRNRVVQAP